MTETILTQPKKKPIISIISALDKDSYSIGKKSGGLPWKISEDFKYFKKITTGHPIIMGRKTFEEFPKLLPNRKHIVITQNKNYKTQQEVIVTNSIESAIKKASQLDDKEIFIIGGSQIYKLGIPFADKLYLTFVKANFNSPIKFPKFDQNQFRIISKKKSSDENFSFEFVVLKRR